MPTPQDKYKALVASCNEVMLYGRRKTATIVLDGERSVNEVNMAKRGLALRM